MSQTKYDTGWLWAKIARAPHEQPVQQQHEPSVNLHSEHVPDGVVLAVDAKERGVRNLLVLGVHELGFPLLQLVRRARLGAVHRSVCTMDGGD